MPFTFVFDCRASYLGVQPNECLRRGSGRVVILVAAAILPLAAPVAQLDRVTASEAVGCAFEPRRAHVRKGIAVGAQFASIVRRPSAQAGNEKPAEEEKNQDPKDGHERDGSET